MLWSTQLERTSLERACMHPMWAARSPRHVPVGADGKGACEPWWAAPPRLTWQEHVVAKMPLSGHVTSCLDASVLHWNQSLLLAAEARGVPGVGRTRTCAGDGCRAGQAVF